VLRIFIALKNPLPWPGLNLQPLGPVASTLTTTPPRRLNVSVSVGHSFQTLQYYWHVSAPILENLLSTANNILSVWCRYFIQYVDI
jgi:hypothetical protein